MGIGGRVVAGAAVAAAAGAAGYVGLVTGAIAPDLGIGRRTRPLGPIEVGIAAPREVVFDVIAQPYTGRRTRSMESKISILAAGSDLVLAAHRTPIRGRLVAVTVETVHLQRPSKVDFKLVRGPVPYVVETFSLEETTTGTRLLYTGDLGTDLWAVGRRWGDLVAVKWESAVAETLEAVRSEAERRALRR